MNHTHGMITSKFLRAAFAAELWQARAALRRFDVQSRSNLRYGMEAGIWAIQKALNNDRI